MSVGLPPPIFVLQPACHSQMNAQPAILGKTEEELLSMGTGLEQIRTGKSFADLISLAISIVPHCGVRMDIDYAMTQPGIPLPSIVFDFCEFRHSS